MKQFICTSVSFLSICTLFFIFSGCSDDKDSDFTTESESYYNILQPKGTPNNRIEYTITYPKAVKNGSNVIVTIKANVLTGSPSEIILYNFHSPSNGILVSSNNDMKSDNPAIKIQEFVFKPNSTGQLKIDCSEMILGEKHITINVLN